MANENSNIPTHKAYNIRDRGEGKKAVWTEVAVGWTNKDGSLNLVFNLLPLDGKVQVRVYEPRDKEGDANT
jgi:hypothetical protein